MEKYQAIGIAIIITLQIFFAGVIVGHEFDFTKSKGKLVLMGLLVATSGSIIFIVSLVWVTIPGLFKRAYNALHIGFILRYIVFKRPLLEYTPEKLQVMKHQAMKKKKNLKWWRFGDMTYIYACNWIEKHYAGK
jgi:hypothetical protein